MPGTLNRLAIGKSANRKCMTGAFTTIESERIHIPKVGDLRRSRQILAPPAQAETIRFAGGNDLMRWARKQSSNNVCAGLLRVHVNFALPPALHVCGKVGARRKKRVISSPQYTTGSPKASTPKT